MKKKISLIILTVLLISLFVFSVTGCQSYREFPGSGKEKGSVDLTLRFDEQGNFKILQMTDIQFINYIDDESIAVMDATIEYANPDLIVVTGDQISPEYLGGQSGKARKICKQITGYFDSKEIPWTLCFGNHDGAMGVLSKKEMVEEYQKSAYFVGGLEENDYCDIYISTKVKIRIAIISCLYIQTTAKALNTEFSLWTARLRLRRLIRDLLRGK